MRLARVNTGHSLLNKVKLTVFGAVARDRAPDVLRLLLYRPELFGQPFMEYVNLVLRGPSAWTPGERELLAAHVSKLNRCEFCFGSHYAVAVRALGEELVDAALSDPETSEVSREVKGAMRFLCVLTSTPGDVSGRDVQTARESGIDDSGIEELIHLSSIFCTINTLADSLGFEVPAAQSFSRMAGPLLKHGYVV